MIKKIGSQGKELKGSSSVANYKMANKGTPGTTRTNKKKSFAMAKARRLMSPRTTTPITNSVKLQKLREKIEFAAELTKR